MFQIKILVQFCFSRLFSYWSNFLSFVAEDSKDVMGMDMGGLKLDKNGSSITHLRRFTLTPFSLNVSLDMITSHFANASSYYSLAGTHERKIIHVKKAYTTRHDIYL